MYCRMCGKKLDSDKNICEGCERIFSQNESPVLKDASISNDTCITDSMPEIVAIRDNSKQKNNSSKINKPKYFINENGLPFFVVFLIILGLGLFIDVFILSDRKVDRIHYNNKYEKEDVSQNSKNKINSKGFLNDMVREVCYGDYEIIYKSIYNDGMGIFMCSDRYEIYSFKEDRRESYFTYGKAEYYGTIRDDLVEKYFPNAHYLYRKLYNEAYHDELILLLAADSETELVEKNIDAVYAYIKELNKEYKTDLDITILYTNSLDTVKTTMDYILLATYTKNVPWLPHGNGFGKYILEVDSNYECLQEIGADKTLYSSQTRDALKLKRHIYTQITNGREITKESLKRRLENSFVQGNN